MSESRDIIGRQAAEALLDAGLSVPLAPLRLPFCRPWTLRLTMRRPCLGGLVRLAREYLSLGVSFERMRRMTQDEALAFIAKEGPRLARMVALTVCRGYWSGRLLVRPLSWLIRWRMPREYLLGVQTLYVAYLGELSDFSIITASIARLNPMTPMMAGQRRGEERSQRAAWSAPIAFSDKSGRSRTPRAGASATSSGVCPTAC